MLNPWIDRHVSKDPGCCTQQPGPCPRRRQESAPALVQVEVQFFKLGRTVNPKGKINWLLVEMSLESRRRDVLAAKTLFELTNTCCSIANTAQFMHAASSGCCWTSPAIWNLKYTELYSHVALRSPWSKLTLDLFLNICHSGISEDVVLQLIVLCVGKKGCYTPQIPTAYELRIATQLHCNGEKDVFSAGFSLGWWLQAHISENEPPSFGSAKRGGRTRRAESDHFPVLRGVERRFHGKSLGWPSFQDVKHRRQPFASK